MIYFGQEVEEPANGESGFSGNDGRTTIFDYWNVPEHQKWMNEGKFDGGLLSDEQKYLRNYYRRLLNFVNNNEAIFKGRFYDIMWYNQDDSLINANKIYAYLRYTEKQKLLIVVNFDSNKQEFKLKIPQDALKEISLETKNEIIAKDILNNAFEVIIAPKQIESHGIELSLNAYESLILRLS